MVRDGTSGRWMRAFAGGRPALRAICSLVPGARAYATAPGLGVFVLPLTDDVHDGLHRANGTGEWLELGAEGFAPLLTTTDIACVAQASIGSALAWMEFCDGNGGMWQMAATWIDGAVAMKPNLLAAGEARPRMLRPVNMALRLLGVKAAEGEAQDELAASGIDRYASPADLAARAMPALV